MMHQKQEFNQVKQEYRILQSNVIFIHGLPEAYASAKQLDSELSIYGEIESLTIQPISKNFYSSFVRYKTQTSACLAITALDGFWINNRFLKVSFASTKFCPNFLKGLECYVKNCNYAHYYVSELTHLKDFSKQINHQVLAFNKIYQNYQEALMILFKVQRQSSVFPSGVIKLNEIIFIKSEQFYNWERMIQESIDLLEKQLQKLKTNKQFKSLKKTAHQTKPIPNDDWLDIDDSISDYLESQTEDNLKSLKRSKTEIEKFLDEAQNRLMGMIFNSGVESPIFQARKL